MSSILAQQVHAALPALPSIWSRLSQHAIRSLATTSTSSSPTSPLPSQPSPTAESSTNTSTTSPSKSHFKITLRRSAISLGEKKQGTLVSLGIHRRMQTVYHRHSPEVAGKILSVKELVEVENVSEDMVKTKQQQRQERKAKRGYKVVGSRKGSFLGV